MPSRFALDGYAGRTWYPPVGRAQRVTPASGGKEAKKDPADAGRAEADDAGASSADVAADPMAGGGVRDDCATPGPAEAGASAGTAATCGDV